MAHRPWRVAPAGDVDWNCDLAATYGDSPLAEFLDVRPALAFVADGSPVQVFRGRTVELTSPAEHVQTAAEPHVRRTVAAG